jgi:uncharacterized protein YjbJ (UPF0337 family)
MSGENIGDKVKGLAKEAVGKIAGEDMEREGEAQQKKAQKADEAERAEEEAAAKRQEQASAAAAFSASANATTALCILRVFITPQPPMMKRYASLFLVLAVLASGAVTVPATAATPRPERIDHARTVAAQRTPAAPTRCGRPT